MMRSGWLIPVLGVTFVVCTSPQTISIPIDLIGSSEREVSESAPREFLVGESVLASIRVSNHTDTTVVVTHYRVRVLAPRTVNDVSPDRLTNTIVPLNFPERIEPGGRIFLDWRFEILVAMASRPGPHRLLMSVPELNMVGDVEFVAVDRGR